MPGGGNFNLLDPKVQEDIRRRPHEYVSGEGRHGFYKDKPYIHQEYPKVMDHTPAPLRKGFKSEPEFEQARQEWEQGQSASIVRNKEDEKRWLAEHKAS